MTWVWWSKKSVIPGDTAWKVSKYGIFSGPYFPVFRLEKTPRLDTFHAVRVFRTQSSICDGASLWKNSKCYNCYCLTVFRLVWPEIFEQLETVMKITIKRYLFKEEKYQCACLSSVLLCLLLHARKDVSRQTKKSHFNTIKKHKS